MARAVAGILGKGDTILMQDDDLLIGEDLIQIAVDALEVAPNSIFGIMGRNLIDGKYTLESEVSGRAGIILGRVLIMRRATLMRCMSLYDGNLLFRFHDDIFYSLVNKLKFGEQNYVISNSGCINLDEEGIGVSWDPEHLNNRNKTVRHVQQLVGWKFTGE